LLIFNFSASISPCETKAIGEMSSPMASIQFYLQQFIRLIQEIKSEKESNVCK